MKRALYQCLAYVSLAFALVGIVLPLLPTVPLAILAAFFFARSNPAERRIVEHSRMRPHIEAWRQRGAISRRGKAWAIIAFALSTLAGVLFLDFPLAIIPILAAVIGGSWILSARRLDLHHRLSNSAGL